VDWLLEYFLRSKAECFIEVHHHSYHKRLTPCSIQDCFFKPIVAEQGAGCEEGTSHILLLLQISEVGFIVWIKWGEGKKESRGKCGWRAK
jgi:hypothetical protein